MSITGTKGWSTQTSTAHTPSSKTSRASGTPSQTPPSDASSYSPCSPKSSKDDRIVAVKPNPAFANYFTAASEVRATHPKADESSEATKVGATGLEPAFVSPSRSAQGIASLSASMVASL